MEDQEVGHAFNLCAVYGDLAVVPPRDDKRVDPVKAPVSGYDPCLKINTAKTVGNATFIRAKLLARRPVYELKGPCVPQEIHHLAPVTWGTQHYHTC